MAKVYAFISIVEVVRPFLIKYQTDKPVLPFLGKDLFRLICCLLRRIFKSEVIDSLSEVNLKSLDLRDKEHLLPTAKIDVGFMAKEVKKLKISELRVMDFRVSVRDYISAVVRKIQEKGPLNYSITRFLDFLDPAVTPSPEGARHFSLILKKMEELKRVEGRACDRLQTMFVELQDTMKKEEVEFNRSVDHLDEFWATRLSGKTELLQCFQQLLILSHGQAAVERGFSFNKQLLCENKTPPTIVSQRTILDHIHKIGGIENITITDGLLASVKQSRQRYQLYLDKQRKAEEDDSSSRKRKDREEEVERLAKRAKQWDGVIVGLNEEEDSLATEAEKDNDFSLLVRSNALRTAAKEKAISLAALQKELKELKSSD